MSSALSSADQRRVILSAGLLKSDHAGEVVNAARAIDNILQKGNLDLVGVLRRGLAPPSPELPAGDKFRGHSRSKVEPVDLRTRHQTIARMCLAYSELLDEWERGFLNNLAAAPRITDKQRSRLQAIEAKIERSRPR